MSEGKKQRLGDAFSSLTPVPSPALLGDGFILAFKLLSCPPA